MPRIAVLSSDRSTVQAYPATDDEINAVYPRLRLGTELRDDSLTEWPRVVLVHEIPAPIVGFGERAVELAPVNDAGTWQQTWTVETITLTEAKQQLGRLAISIYWDRLLAVPDVPEFQAAGRNGVAVLQARATRFQAKIDDVAVRIQAATSIVAAHAIYAELETLA